MVKFNLRMIGLDADVRKAIYSTLIVVSSDFESGDMSREEYRYIVGCCNAILQQLNGWSEVRTNEQ